MRRCSCTAATCVTCFTTAAWSPTVPRARLASSTAMAGPSSSTTWGQTVPCSRRPPSRRRPVSDRGCRPPSIRARPTGAAPTRTCASNAGAPAHAAPRGERAAVSGGAPSDLEDLEQSRLGLGLDPRDHLDVILQARAAQLLGEQLVDLEDAGAVGHRDLHPHRTVLAGDDLDVLDRVGRDRVDVVLAGLVRDP